jgi:hypothetical protein
MSTAHDEANNDGMALRFWDSHPFESGISFRKKAFKQCSHPHLSAKILSDIEIELMIIDLLSTL